MNTYKKIIIVFTLAAIGLGVYLTARLPRLAQIDFDVPQSMSSGDEIHVPLRISSGQTTNAAEFYFTYPTDLLEVTAIDKNGSFYQLWVKDSPSFDNSSGLLYLAGGLPNPGFVGKNGLIATVTFTAKKPGSGEITLDQAKSRILANDGLGSQIPAAHSPVRFTIE